MVPFAGLLAQPYQPRTEATPPRVYPNNTLIADLSKCHAEQIHLWPQFKLESRYRSFLGALAKCWTRAKEHLVQGPATPSICANNTQQPNQPEAPPQQVSIRMEEEKKEKEEEGDKKKEKQTGEHENVKQQEKRQKEKQDESFTFKMPEPLLKARVKLKREDYDRALSTLTRDLRYQMHLLLFNRIQALWLLISTILCISIPYLLLAPEVLVFSYCLTLWLLLQVVGSLGAHELKKRVS